jgi:hypothetical protein
VNEGYDPVEHCRSMQLVVLRTIIVHMEGNRVSLEYLGEVGTGVGVAYGA